MVKREATCSCGQLRLTCEGEPLSVSMCHCLDCQRRTGSAFGLPAWFPRDRVSAPLGAAQRYTRRADSGRTVTFNFCPGCGGTVFWEAELRPELVGVAVGTFADPGFPKPTLSGWERRQHPWTTAIGGEGIDHRD